MMKLIVNADDFGLSEAVNHGIIKAYTAGVVRSTTLMVNMNAVEHALELSKAYPQLGVGIHLTLTAGKPLSGKAASLVDGAGNFWKQLSFFTKLEEGTIKLVDIETEWRTQIETARKLGFAVTHLDSHHHVHLHSELAALSFKLAGEYKLPLRIGKANAAARNAAVRTSDYFSMEFYGEGRTVHHVIDCIAPHSNEDISFELMVHPAYVDKTLLQATGYALARLDELEALTNDELLQYIKSTNIKLVNFEELK
ncbi:MAG: chitin disaccharide deacetylase [Spirochaetaceae bacterium]|jgi:predicted glycoside hydrolase/deacetylase ChbG (UPF0249 family)|nr:chitin disaccharide deacetylase [Spirochaetaceae bacterium]